MKLRIATIISRLFEPFVVMGVMAWLAVTHSTLPEASRLPFFCIAILITIGLPVLLLLVSLKKRWITDWDIHTRAERPKALAILICIEAVSIMTLRTIADPFLVMFMMVLLVWLTGFSVITLSFKISGHSGITALATGLIITWFGWGYWPVLLAVPIVAWSRVIRKDHTLVQVIAGAFYSWAILWVLSVMFQVS
jgi:hypothetical protein